MKLARERLSALAGGENDPIVREAIAGALAGRSDQRAFHALDAARAGA